MLTRRDFLRLSGLGLAAVAVGCAGQQPAAPSGQPARGGRLTIGIGSIPPSMDPHVDSTANSLPCYAQLFEKLVAADEKGNIVPVLAESWRSVSDTVWEFKLRSGVKFHNGQELTAEDVKFSIERVLDPKTTSPWRGRVDRISRVEAVDSLTVRVETSGPFSPLLQGLSVVDIIPARYFQDVGPQGFATAPVGTGPFVFKEWVRQERLVVTANGSYWRGRPALDEVVFRAIPADASRIVALEAGDVDVALLIPPDQVDRLRSRGFQIRSVNLGQGLVVNLRQTPGTPLASRQVRQALNYAVDKNMILEKLLLGYGRVLDGQVVGPDCFGYNPDLKPYPYDPARARALLAEAGYGGGFEVTFHGTVGRYTKDKEIEEAVIGQLAEVGVKANLQVLEAGVFIQSFLGATIGPMFIWAWQYLPAMDADLPLNFFRSDSVAKLMAQPRFDELIDRERRAFDTEARRRILQEANAYLRDDPPCIFLAQTPGVYAVKPTVDGFSWQPTYLFDLTKVTVRQG